MLHLGDVPANSTLYIPFATYAGSTGASATLTGLAVTDIEIYKNGSVTQRASDAGYALLDTDGIDFDGITGIHGFSIDLSDNTDAGFFSVGAFYWVVVSAVTVDSQTVNFIAATFRVVAAEAVSGTPKVDVGAISGDATAADSIEAAFDGTGANIDLSILTVGSCAGNGRYPANMMEISGDSVAADNLEAAADGTGYNLGGGSIVAASVTGAVGSVTATVTANTTLIEGVDATDQLEASAAAGADADAIALAVAAALAAQTNVTIIAPVSGDSITIKKGDAYNTTTGQTIVITKSGASWPTDLTGFTIDMDVYQTHNAAGDVPASPDELENITGAITQATGSNAAVRIDMTAAQTSGLEPGQYDFYVRATNSSNVNTLRQGVMRVIDNDPTA